MKRGGGKLLEELRAERHGEERRLRSLATRLRTAADRIDLAATYWGDGAYLTARSILTGRRPGERNAASLILEVVRSINGERWHK